jgi:hypothetical protein
MSLGMVAWGMRRVCVFLCWLLEFWERCKSLLSPPPSLLCVQSVCVCTWVCVRVCVCVCGGGGGGYAAGFVLVGRCAEHTAKLQDTSDTTTSTPPPLPPRMRVQANTFAFILAPDPLSAPWKRTSEPKPKGWQGQCHIEGIPI